MMLTLLLPSNLFNPRCVHNADHLSSSICYFCNPPSHSFAFTTKRLLTISPLQMEMQVHIRIHSVREKHKPQKVDSKMLLKRSSPSVRGSQIYQQQPLNNPLTNSAKENLTVAAQKLLSLQIPLHTTRPSESDLSTTEAPQKLLEATYKHLSNLSLSKCNTQHMHHLFPARTSTIPCDFRLVE